MDTFLEFISAGNASETEALRLFDSLDAVETDFMFGKWLVAYCVLILFHSPA